VAGPYVTLAFLLLAGLSFLLGGLAWIYITAVLVFELWLARRIGAVGRDPVLPGEPPYHFTPEEARLVGRYRFHFTFPGVSRQAASVLAAIGLASLVLAPWLTIKHQFVEAVLVGINLFAVARFTRVLSPALPPDMVEHHRSAWSRIRSANQKTGTDPIYD
jgi:hypothetical protein